MSRWPHDNQRELIAFYGNPGSPGASGVSAQLVRVVPPFKMYYDKQQIKHLMFHRKAATALLAALNEIWEHVGRDQATLDKLGVSQCAGTYNPRRVRGSATKWSNHAFGAAIDINDKQNGLYAKGNMPSFVVAAFERQGFRWGGKYKGRKDPMHFEACDNGLGLGARVAGIIIPNADADEAEDADETSNNGMALADGQDTDTPDAPEPEPKTMAASKIGNTSVIAGAGTSVLAAGQVVSSIAGPAGDVADQVSTVTDKAGHVLEVTKQVISVPKPGFWMGLLHVITGPVFMGSVLLVVVAAFAATWFWRWRDYGRGQQP